MRLPRFFSIGCAVRDHDGTSPTLCLSRVPSVNEPIPPWTALVTTIAQSFPQRFPTHPPVVDARAHPRLVRLGVTQT